MEPFRPRGANRKSVQSPLAPVTSELAFPGRGTLSRISPRRVSTIDDLQSVFTDIAAIRQVPALLALSSSPPGKPTRWAPMLMAGGASARVAQTFIGMAVESAKSALPTAFLASIQHLTPRRESGAAGGCIVDKRSPEPAPGS